MRNIFKSLMLVAVAAMTFTACQKDNGEVNALSKGTTLTVTANLADNDTRVAFGDLVDGVRKVTWEAGDKVSFIAYRNDAIYTFVNDLEVEADGATATFSVEFPKPLQSGDRIEALVGHYVRESFGDIFTHEQQQQPTDEGLSTVYVKAVVDYDGNNDLSLTFNHMYPYGRMITDFATKFEEVKFVLDGILENGDSFQETVTIYPQNITGNDYWFYCENEFIMMETMSIEARGVDNRKYFKTIDNLLEKNFALLKGQIAAFKVGSFQTPLATPVAKATLTTVSSMPAIEITWEAVENAYQYIISCEQTGEIATIHFENQKGCYWLFNELKYDTEYSFTIYANPGWDSKEYIKSDVCTVSARTPKDVNAAADYNVTLTKVTSISGNTINFAGENPQDRMRLEFNSGLTSIEAGTYAVVVDSFTSSTALEVSNTSQFNMAEAYSTMYDYYVNPGDLVNVAKSGDEYTITVITDTWINSVSASKSVKLTYTGKLEVATEDEGGEGATGTIEYLGQWYDIGDDDPTTSGGGFMYKVVADGVEYMLELYWAYADETGAIKEGTYNYCYNTVDGMYSGYNGFSIISDAYYYGSTLTAADGVVTLDLRDVNGSHIGTYVLEGVSTFN